MSCVTCPREREHLVGTARVQHITRRDAGLSRDADPNGDIVQPVGRMRIGADLDHHAKCRRARNEAPVEIEALGICVELHGHAECPRFLEHGVHIDRIWVALEQQPTGWMAEDREVRIIQGAEHAPGHFGFIHVEPGMYRPDDKIEVAEQLGVVVECAVGQDVGFNAFEDAEVARRRVQRVDLPVLLVHALARESARVKRGQRMVGDADVAPSTIARGRCHLGDRCLAVGVAGVAVQRTANVGAPPVTSPDAPALQIASALLSGGESSRLNQALVYRQQIAGSANFDADLRTGPGLLIATAVAAGGKPLAQVQAALLAEVRRLATQPIPPAELAKVKTQLLTATLLSRQTPTGLGMAVAEAAVLEGGAAQVNLGVEALQQVTAKQVQQAMQRYVLGAHKVTITYRQAEASK